MLGSKLFMVLSLFSIVAFTFADSPDEGVVLSGNEAKDAMDTLSTYLDHNYTVSKVNQIKRKIADLTTYTYYVNLLKNGDAVPKPCKVTIQFVNNSKKLHKGPNPPIC